MPWIEVLPEHVSDQDTVSFRFLVTGPAASEAWLRGDVHLGIGSLEGEEKPAPEWWMDVLLSDGQSPYRGNDVKELVATAPLGPRSYGFDEVGAQIWVVLDSRWVLAGSFETLTDDPEWTLDRLGPERRRNAPPLTNPDPSTSHPSPAPVVRVWLRENPRELWFAGRHGWGRHLHSVELEEKSDAVYLTCLIGWTPEYESKVRAVGGSEPDVRIPMVGCGWTCRKELQQALGTRKVFVQTSRS